MKQLYKIIVLLLTVKQLDAQLGAQFNMFTPVNDIAYILKPGFGAEIFAKSGKANSFFKIGGAIGFAGFTATQDTFPVYAIRSNDDGSNTLLPGYISLKSYQLYSLGLTSEFKLRKEEKKLSPIAGLDAYWYIISFSQNYHTETFDEGETQNESTWSIAIVPKVGLSYVIKEKWLLSATFGRSMGWGPGGLQSFWKSSVGLTFYFE